MKDFEPGLFDKLFDDAPRSSVIPALRRLSAEELKDTIARDLEALLNTRTVFVKEDFTHFPECDSSVLTYGLNDFANLSIASHNDREFICNSIQRAIAHHEPRLNEVKVSLEVKRRGSNDLYFGISAKLNTGSEQEEAVNFDALLQPAILHYSVSRGRVVPGNRRVSA